MRNRRVFVVSIFLVILGGLTSCNGAAGGNDFEGQAAYQYAATQVSMGPRFPGSQGHADIQIWLRETLTNLGWEVEFQSFSYLDLELTNVIARLPGQASSQSPLILGAHFDTRPLSDQDPLNPSQPVLGANDGASGVAVLLELARVLSGDPPEVPIWLAFFDGEDSGNLAGWDWIVGSTYFADNLTLFPSAVVIVDMVGDQDLQLYYDRNSDAQISSEIWAVAASLGYHDFIQEYKYSMIDDHIPFSRLGIPAVDIIDFDYPAWHTTEDTLDQISADSLEQVGRTLQTWIYQQSD